MILLYNWINRDKDVLNDFKIKSMEKVFGDKDEFKKLLFIWIGCFELKPH